MLRFRFRALVVAALALAGVVAAAPAANAQGTSCTPVSGGWSICFDPTTGFGPVLYLYNASGALVTTWGGSNIVASGTCATGTATNRFNFSNAPGGLVVFGTAASQVLGVFAAGNTPAGCSAGGTAPNPPRGEVIVSTTAWDEIRFHIALRNIQRARLVL